MVFRKLVGSRGLDCQTQADRLAAVNETRTASSALEARTTSKWMLLLPIDFRSCEKLVWFAGVRIMFSSCAAEALSKVSAMISVVSSMTSLIIHSANVSSNSPVL